MTTAAKTCPVCATASKILTYSVVRPFSAVLLLGHLDASREKFAPGQTILDSTLSAAEITARLASGHIVQS